MKELSPRTETLILTAHDDDDYVLALMEAGALGYLLKTTRMAELIDAIQCVHRGEPVLHAVIARKVARLWLRQRGAAGREHGQELSSRELSVLKLAAKGLRNKAIAEELGISARTVDGHFRGILAKLGSGREDSGGNQVEADTTVSEPQHYEIGAGYDDSRREHRLSVDHGTAGVDNQQPTN